MIKRLDAEEQTLICMSVIEQLNNKLQEFYDLYDKLSTTYRAEVTMTGITVLAIVDSLPVEEPAGICTIGTAPGVLKALSDIFDKVVDSLDIGREDLAKMLVTGYKEDSDE